jgi:hypothetical protein
MLYFVWITLRFTMAYLQESTARAVLLSIIIKLSYLEDLGLLPKYSNLLALYSAMSGIASTL